MDREQEEMQFLGLFGIYIEAHKLIIRFRKIFSQITLALIVPLSVIFLAHQEIARILYWRIRYTKYKLDRAQTGTPAFHSLSDLLTNEWAVYILFKATYFVFLLIFSLLSTAAVVYTIACIYTSREVTFKKVVSVVPRVWKRLMVTFFCIFLGLLAYNTVFFLALILWYSTIRYTSTVGSMVLLIIFIAYLVGFVYMTVIWHLASVITVLEDSYGLKAMIKSKNLIKGKMVAAIVIFFKLNFTLAAVDSVFSGYVVSGYWRRIGTMKVIGMGALCFLLLLKLILFALVVQTVIYFVCKSYHHENIDKSALSDHLEVYLGEYVPLKAKDVQLEEYHV